MQRDRIFHHARTEPAKQYVQDVPVAFSGIDYRNIEVILIRLGSYPAYHEFRNLQSVCQFGKLEEALAFFETLRFLYQMIDVQEEEIRFGEDQVKEKAGEIACLMGYGTGSIDSVDRHLLSTYREQLYWVGESVAPLLEDLREHLGNTSKLTRLMYYPSGKNLAEEIMEIVRCFRGATYWEDITANLENNRQDFRRRLVDAFKELAPVRRKTVINRFVRLMMYDLRYLIRYLTLLAVVKENKDDEQVFQDFNSAFLREFTRIPDSGFRLTKLFLLDPKLLGEYLSLLDDSQLGNFPNLLEEGAGGGRINPEAVSNLKLLVMLILEGSRYFKNFLDRVVSRHPESLHLLGNPESLKVLSSGMSNNVHVYSDPTVRKKFLRAYYDLEFLRSAMKTMTGSDVTETNEEFTHFSDRYIFTLYNICKEEIEAEIDEYLAVQDIFAIFASGGHSRRQAYNDDYDMIVILNGTDEDLRSKLVKILTKMNRAIAGTNMLPHYRFADWTGSYIIHADELKTFLSSGRQDDFIEKSQLLGSRMVVGTGNFERKLEEEILSPFIYKKSKDYIRTVVEEIYSRHSHVGSVISELDLKECKGGLRDIELILLVFKAHFNLREPVSDQLMKKLVKLDPEHARDFRALWKKMLFLRRLRDLNRLTVSTQDIIEPERLRYAAEILGLGKKGGSNPEERIIRKFKSATRKVVGIIDRLTKDIELKGWTVG